VIIVSQLLAAAARCAQETPKSSYEKKEANQPLAAGSFLLH